MVKIINKLNKNMENLKIFDQLTDNELLELTQEQIDWYIKLKKAESGIRIITCPTMPETREIPGTDLVLYDVSGFNFIDRETAEEVSKFINSKIAKAYTVDYDWGVGSDKKYAKPFTGNLVDVKLENVYSETTYNSIKNILISNEKIMRAFKDLKNEYDDMEEKATEIVDKIYNTINEARGRKQQYEEYVIRIQEYLRLANGDTKVAWNFFDKAYEIEPTVKNRIMESEEYNKAVDGYKPL